MAQTDVHMQEPTAAAGTLQVTIASSSGHTARIYAGATIRVTKVQ